MWDIGYRYRAYIVRCVSILFSILYKIQDTRYKKQGGWNRNQLTGTWNMEHLACCMLDVGRWKY